MTNLTPATETESTPFTIKTASDEDIILCAQLEAGYETQYVWQMHFEEGERAVQCSFSQVRLPRLMPVAYPYSSSALQSQFESADCLLTAWYYDDLIGCLSGAVEAWHSTFVLHHLIIHPSARRKGVGKRLFKLGQQWAYQNECARILTTMQTKNYPAIQFARSQGFVFCGYNDKLYLNGDIALMYMASV